MKDCSIKGPAGKGGAAAESSAGMPKEGCSPGPRTHPDADDGFAGSGR